MLEPEKIKEYVEEWMQRYEKDTFIENKKGEMMYKSECGTTSINLKIFFKDFLEDFLEDVKIILNERL